MHKQEEFRGFHFRDDDVTDFKFGHVYFSFNATEKEVSGIRDILISENPPRFVRPDEACIEAGQAGSVHVLKTWGADTQLHTGIKPIKNDLLAFYATVAFLAQRHKDATIDINVHRFRNPDRKLTSRPCPSNEIKGKLCLTSDEFKCIPLNDPEIIKEAATEFFRRVLTLADIIRSKRPASVDIRVTVPQKGADAQLCK